MEKTLNHFNNIFRNIEGNKFTIKEFSFAEEIRRNWI